jgi:hypothetical protein
LPIFAAPFRQPTFSMVIQDILAIAGKPGLFKILSSNRTTLVVESMLDRKRMSIPGTVRVSSLGDITMFTTGDDLHIRHVLTRMHDHLKGAQGIDHRAEAGELRAFIDAIIPELDHNRVYNSDLKKLIQWYNTLIAQGAFPLEMREDLEATDAAAEGGSEAEATAAVAAPAAKPGAAAKGTKGAKSAVTKAAPKSTAPKASAKSAPAKAPTRVAGAKKGG